MFTNNIHELGCHLNKSMAE